MFGILECRFYHDELPNGRLSTLPIVSVSIAPQNRYIMNRFHSEVELQALVIVGPFRIRSSINAMPDSFT